MSARDRNPESWLPASDTVRWLLWLGGLMTVGGMWWLFQGVDLAAGTQDSTALVGGAALFLVGMVLMGWGMGARKPDG